MDREEAIRRIRAWNLDADDLEVLGAVIPELAESEDEQALRIIKKRMCYDPVPISDEDRRIVENWLEKQKDIEERWLKDREGCFWDGVAEGRKQKEQKPVQDETEREYVRTIKSIIADFIRDKKPEDVGYYQQIYDWLDGRHIEQKPAEWSEEDERNYEYLHQVICCYINNPQIEYKEREKASKKLIPFWESLKFLRSQPKQVWTEEDDRICHLIMANLSESARHAITLPMETVNDFNNWLRTLQCMPPVFTDWNEEDQTLLSDALGCVTMVQELKKRGKLKNFHISCSYDELRSWVRSLKSRPRKQPQWKPSEEQMKALQNAVALTACDKELARLYNQLKKL